MPYVTHIKADVNTYNDECQTALTLASWHGYTEGVDILIKAGADLNKEGGSGDNHTPLLFACKGGYIKSVESVLEAGADVNISSQYGYTALFIDTYATYPYEYKECLRAVLRAGIQINRVNFLHRNALAEVLEHKHKKGARLLFAIGETLDDKVPKRLISDCLDFDDLQLELKHMCREAIRKHLLKLDVHSNLFNRIPRLGLTEVLNQYLLYGVSFDDDDEDEEEEEDFGCYDDYGCDDDNDDDDSDELMTIVVMMTMMMMTIKVVTTMMTTRISLAVDQMIHIMMMTMKMMLMTQLVATMVMIKQTLTIMTTVMTMKVSLTVGQMVLCDD